MPWTLLFSFLGSLPGTIGDYFKAKNEITKTKLENELAIQRANIALASDVAKAQFELNKAIVVSTTSAFKYVTFTVWFGPFVIGVLFPSWGSYIFNNLASMPEWYVSSVVTIMFTIWGIQIGAPVVSGIFSNLGEFFQSRRAFKIEKAKVLNEQILAIELRKNLFKNGMTQEQWEAILNATKTANS